MNDGLPGFPANASNVSFRSSPATGDPNEKSRVQPGGAGIPLRLVRGDGLSRRRVDGERDHGPQEGMLEAKEGQGLAVLVSYKGREE